VLLKRKDQHPGETDGFDLLKHWSNSPTLNVFLMQNKFEAATTGGGRQGRWGWVNFLKLREYSVGLRGYTRSVVHYKERLSYSRIVKVVCTFY